MSSDMDQAAAAQVQFSHSNVSKAAVSQLNHLNNKLY